MRKTHLKVGLVLAASTALLGCGDPHVSLAEEKLEICDRMVTLMASVTDEPRAVNAAPKLKETYREFIDNERRFKALGPISDEKVAREVKFLNTESARLISHYLQHVYRTARRPELLKHLPEFELDPGR